MIRLTRLAALFGLLIIAACSQSEQNTENNQASGPDYNLTYDLYISGGTIVDGSGEPSYAGDLLVSGDKIAYVGTVDASKVKLQ